MAYLWRLQCLRAIFPALRNFLILCNILIVALFPCSGTVSAYKSKKPFSYFVFNQLGNSIVNVLIVDSDQIQVQCLVRGLKSRGHSVFTATSKAESYSALENPANHIHLLLADLNVPQLNVFELIQKGRTRNKTLPTIIMTTYIKPQLQDRVQDDPFIALIEKPFGLEKLINEINWFDNL